MGAILIASPPSSPTLGHHAMTSQRRYRPTLPTLAFVAFHIALFAYYRHNWKSSSLQVNNFTPRPAEVPPRLDNLRSSDPTLTLSSSLPSLATTSCEVCHLDPSNPLCEYGLDAIRMSRAYEGSGARLRRVLQKALRGEEITVGVLGASVTQGHSLGPGEERWQDKWFRDFQTLFPKSKMVTGAVGAMDSRFFAYCFEALVPKDLDIYIVEVDINNSPALEQLRDDDAFMRALLQLPQEPAVLRVSTFALLFPELARGIISGLATSQFHDIPMVGIRNFLLPHTIHHREAAEQIFALDAWGNRDYRHISKIGHAALGDMLSLYMRKEVCETQRRQVLPPAPPVPKTGPWPLEEDLGKIVPLALWSSWTQPKNLDPVTPLCQTAFSPLSPLKPISHSSTFSLHEWNGKAAWAASLPGSQIRFRFVGTKVGLFVWATNGVSAEEQSADAKKRRETGPGKAMCWVEDGEMSDEEWAKAYGETGQPEPQSYLVNSHWPEKVAAGPEFVELAEGLHPGEHVLACEVSRETTSGGYKWRVMGIASQ
ncbi:hypothetical protein JCM6882_007626 [Rhodosporidiobolus microsporus]